MCLCVCIHALQTKKRYAKEWGEAEKATQQAEKTEHDLNATRLDVDKVNTHTHTLPSMTAPEHRFFFISVKIFELTLSISLYFISSPHFHPAPVSVHFSHFAFVLHLLNSSSLYLPHRIVCSKGQAACPCPHTHSGGVQERLRSTSPEIQQGAKLLLLHRDTADLQCETKTHVHNSECRETKQHTLVLSFKCHPSLVYEHRDSSYKQTDGVNIK